MFGPTVELSFPPAHWFGVPGPLPITVPPPPPTEGFDWRSPFNVDPQFYDQSLSLRIPVTIALGYLTFVTAFNQVNRRRGFKPWALSKTSAFYGFTLIHNIGLAVYSAVTCYALLRAVSVSVPSVFGANGLAGTVDALCKINGPRGYGDAVYFDAAQSKWAAKNQAIKLGAGGFAPDPTDVGRIWNEGLAFWGWLFYLSKFYEVVDTLIILAKGRRSSSLQTFHHAGAMMCMWAGIRYMSPPIWMFVLVNACIHTVMYTYYTLSTLGIRVSPWIKRSITTVQIAQFVWGISFAAPHCFISYSLPVATPYSVAAAIQSARSSAYAAAASVDAQSFFKKLAYRAAGAEGLAERVDGRPGQSLNPQGRLLRPSQTDKLYSRQRFETVRCLDTSGQAFAIWLNVVYLLPLTMLFLRFFIKTYFGKSKQKGSAESTTRRLSESTKAATDETTKKVEEFGTGLEKKVDDMADEIEQGSRDLGGNETGDSAKEGDENFGSTIQDILDTVQRKVKETAEEWKMSESSEWVSSEAVETSQGLTDEERITTARQLAEMIQEGRDRKMNGEEEDVSTAGQTTTNETQSSTQASSTVERTTSTSSTSSKKKSKKGGMMEGEWMKRKPAVDSDEKVDFEGKVKVDGEDEEAERRPATPVKKDDDAGEAETPNSRNAGFGLHD